MGGKVENEGDNYVEGSANAPLSPPPLKETLMDTTEHCRGYCALNPARFNSRSGVNKSEFNLDSTLTGLCVNRIDPNPGIYVSAA